MTKDERHKSQSHFSTILIIAGIVIVSAFLVVWIYSTEPKAQREAAIKKTAILVEVEKFRRGTFTPRIEGLGTVEAAQDIILSPRIDGRVIQISDSFIPGGFVKKDEVLVKLDPSDYQNTVQQIKSTLQQAQSNLDIELGRRDVAKKEYEMMGQKLTDENKTLVLRDPQLAAAHASVLSAKAELNQAKLELDRTFISPPFDAQILSRNVNIGSQVNPGMALARIVGIDEYWVIVTVPVARVTRIAFPKNEELGASVKIRNRTAWSQETSREGHVVRLIGALDNQTRLARILVSVKDPLGLQESTQGPEMLVGSVVQAEIEGRPLENVFRIGRDYLREGDRLWLKRDGKLKITQATVLFKDKEYAYISDGMKGGDLLVTSNLATVAEGIGLRTEAEGQTKNATGPEAQ